MSLRFTGNIGSLAAQRRAAHADDLFVRTLERLASGSRINRSSDDAAGLAVSFSLNARAKVFNQGIRNLNDATSALAIADQALNSLSRIVDRQRELAYQAANGVLSDEQRRSLDTEAQELAREYQRILSTTAYNGQSLIDGSLAGLSVQAGFGSSAAINAEILGIEEQEQTIEVLDSLDTSFLDFGTLGDVADIQFYVHDFNSDGFDDLFYIGTEALGSETIDYAMGILLGDASGNYVLSGPVREGTLNPPPVGAVTSVVVEVTSSGVSVAALQGSILNPFHDRDTWDILGGVIQAVPQSDSGQGLLVFGNVEPMVSEDFNDDGYEDTVTADLSADSFTIQTSTLVPQVIEAGAVRSLQQNAFTLAYTDTALKAMEILDELAETISDTRAQIGASESRVRVALNVLRATSENSLTAASRIQDADLAEESSNLLRSSILKSSAAAVLAQANLQPRLALQLLAQ